MKNSTKIGMAIIAAASILGAAYVYAFTGVVEEKAIMAGTVVSVVEPGTAVKEGDVLVTVTSLAGAYLHLGLLLMVSLKKSKWLKDKA